MLTYHMTIQGIPILQERSLSPEGRDVTCLGPQRVVAEPDVLGTYPLAVPSTILRVPPGFRSVGDMLFSDV